MENINDLKNKQKKLSRAHLICSITGVAFALAMVAACLTAFMPGIIAGFLVMATAFISDRFVDAAYNVVSEKVLKFEQIEEMNKNENYTVLESEKQENKLKVFEESKQNETEVVLETGVSK